MGREDEAAKDLASIPEQDRGVKEFYAMGLAANGMAEFEQGIEWFDRSLELDDGNWSTWENKAFAQTSLGLFEDAIVSFDRCLALEQSKVSWNNMGYCLKCLKRFDEALECFGKAIEIDEMYENPWKHKALILLEIGGEDAKEFVDKAVGMHPGLQYELQ
eukprot:TRINITY_DN5522_c0_g1_i1.p2 TRINITY_DN5522_c0_g1~~TRINITY_DN5522_c0_g1_i1.p2  ORF type:complete len:160 (+),score=52.06 TRINITY_DN5522_c0_g1_i1:314-793(+)